jgi:hypothetical protein
MQQLGRPVISVFAFGGQLQMYCVVRAKALEGGAVLLVDNVEGRANKGSQV